MFVGENHQVWGAGEEGSFNGMAIETRLHIPPIPPGDKQEEGSVDIWDIETAMPILRRSTSGLSTPTLDVTNWRTKQASHDKASLT